MTITRFAPFRSSLEDVTVLQNRLNSIFHDFARPADNNSSESLATGNFVPAVDVYENETGLTLKLEVPGIKQEDLDIRVENQTLTVKGERRFEASEKEENFHRIERRFGTFTRSFTLPQMVDTGKVNATYENGVLNIAIAKKAEAKPKQIKVEVNAPQKQVEAQAQAAQNQIAG